MKVFRQVGCLLIIVFLLGLCLSAAAYGMDTALPKETVETWEDTKNQGEVALGKPATEMTARNSEYERCGEDIIKALKSGNQSDSWIKTQVCFDSPEAAHSFGKYFYRYIYLGKETVLLYSAEVDEMYYIYLTCGDPGKAALQHEQVMDKLSQVVDAVQDLDDWAKADYFYNWVYDNMSYDHTLQNKTVYDGVMEGTTVCWGYVSAYLSLCRSAGIECEPVYRGNHAWNRIWLDDQWWYCDITWDQSLGNSTWKFMTQEEMDSDSMHNAL